jgi:hypothetical protein
VIEAVDRIVGRIERRDELLHRERRVRQIGREPVIGFAVAPERRRKVRVRHSALVRLSTAVRGQPIDPGIGAEEMVERAILEEEHDDVIDRRAGALGLLGDTGSSGRAGGQKEREQRQADESWTTIAHAVF